MVCCVLERGWTIEATAERFQVDAKTVRKWRDRFVAEGEAGLQDRSSRPYQSPNRTPRPLWAGVRSLIAGVLGGHRKGGGWFGQDNCPLHPRKVWSGVSRVWWSRDTGF